jgi:hypothetical protein
LVFNEAVEFGDEPSYTKLAVETSHASDSEEAYE